MKRLVVIVVLVVLVLSSSWNIVDENYPCPKWQVSQEWIDDDALLIPWPPEFLVLCLASSWLLPDIWTLSTPPPYPNPPHPLWNVGLGFRGGSPREDLDLNVSKDIILIVFVVLWVDLGFRLNPSKLLTQEESGNNNNRLEFIYLFIYLFSLHYFYLPRSGWGVVH